MHKLSFLKDSDLVEHSFPPVYSLEPTNTGRERLIAGVPGGDSTVFGRLLGLLEPPCILLYVLHTSRGEGDIGRYQSPELSHDQLRSFVHEFGSYLQSDGRFDLWAYSPSEQATLVWDRHNRLFCYGPTERYSSELRAMGFTSGEIQIPAPHVHHYRDTCDAQAAALLAVFDWSYSPLRPEDEQF